MPLGSRKGGADLRKIRNYKFGGAKGTKAGRKFAKENGRKLTVNLEALSDYQNASKFPPMVIRLSSLSEEEDN